MNIVTRGEWGARPARCQAPTVASEAWLHHTVGYGQGGAAYMRQIQRFHMDGRGWCDIAYNYVVDPADGTVYEGRGSGVRPGAQKGHNSGTVAICVMGDFRTDPAPDSLVDTLAELMVRLHGEGAAPKHFDGGHRDAPGQTTTCPGDNLAVRIPEINRRIDQLHEGDDMPLSDEDIRRIWAFPTLTPGVTSQLALTRAERGVNQLLLNRLDDAGQIADKIIEDLGDGLAAEVADELARRLSR